MSDLIQFYSTIDCSIFKSLEQKINNEFTVGVPATFTAWMSWKCQNSAWLERSVQLDGSDGCGMRIVLLLVFLKESWKSFMLRKNNYFRTFTLQ